jgi:hypothetical protein
MARQDPGEPYYRVDSPEAAAMLEADHGDIVVFDVRRDDEWVTGHITGAIHINIDDLPGRMDEVPQDKKNCFSFAPPACAADLLARSPPRLGTMLKTYTTSRMVRQRG